MIFSKVRCTTKREKCQSFLCRSAFGNHFILGLCFHLESSIKWANRYGGGEGGGITKQCWICHCQKNTPHECFILLFGTGQDWCQREPLRPREVSHRTQGRPERTEPLNLATGSEEEPMDTFMHKCLLHAFNGCGPDGFPLLMHYQWELLSASQLQHRQKGLHYLFPSSVLPSTQNQWKFKNITSGEVLIFKQQGVFEVLHFLHANW